MNEHETLARASGLLGGKYNNRFLNSSTLEELCGDLGIDTAHMELGPDKPLQLVCEKIRDRLEELCASCSKCGELVCDLEGTPIEADGTEKVCLDCKHVDCQE